MKTKRYRTFKPDIEIATDRNRAMLLASTTGEPYQFCDTIHGELVWVTFWPPADMDEDEEAPRYGDWLSPQYTALPNYGRGTVPEDLDPLVALALKPRR